MELYRFVVYLSKNIIVKLLYYSHTEGGPDQIRNGAGPTKPNSSASPAPRGAGPTRQH